MLNIKGKLKIQSTGNSTSTQETKFDWKDAIIDALIMSSITLFSTYISTQNIQGSFIAAGLSFCTFLGIKRGIVEKHE